MNITIKTLDRVRDIIYRSKFAVSLNYIAQECNIHPYRVKYALDILTQSKDIKPIKNSTKIDLYTKNES